MNTVARFCVRSVAVICPLPFAASAHVKRRARKCLPPTRHKFRAFVEFTLAFYLATGRAMLRLRAVALLMLFISAMPEFGARDVVGHFPLVAILSVPFLTGCSALQRCWRLPSFGIAANAAMTCLLYVAVLSAFLLLYGGVQRIGQS